MNAQEISPEYIQGTEEWLELRKSKITATDASIIMGVNPWKTKYQLFYEKKSQENNTFVNDRMQRGIDLEPFARQLFTLKTGIEVYPKVVSKDWAMASLDGINDKGDCVVEIKCTGEKDHSIALSGNVPDYYYPQLQHQIYVCDVQEINYFSFDGLDGVIVKVKRDDEYISKMIEEELKFYQCLVNNTPPEPSENDYIERDDDIWTQYAENWKIVTSKMKDLEKEEQEIRNQLILLSGQYNSKGAGISLCQVKRKGNVDYSKIPELKGVDLNVYRKPYSSSWRICSN